MGAVRSWPRTDPSLRIKNQLEQLAFKRSIPFCYNDYIECPSGRCPKCESDDLMRMMRSIFLIYALSKQPNRKARFSELEKLIPVISQRMLSITLKQLEQDGFVRRQAYLEVPPRVEYELTKLGLSLFETIQGIVDWVGKNWVAVKKAREQFDRRPKGQSE